MLTIILLIHTKGVLQNKLLYPLGLCGTEHAGGDVLVSRIRDRVRMGTEVEFCWAPLQSWRDP